MWAQIQGKTRIEIARETIATVLKDFPADRELGLMAYGHREKGACTDIELVVPPAAGSATAISEAVNKINPKGKTPLSDAVKKAAEELRFTEEKATVILVTDGLETCNADPCALGNELEKAGVDFTAHVVGFGLSEEEGQTGCVPRRKHRGKYIQASDAGQLTEALKTTVVVAPEPAPAPVPEPAKPEFNFMQPFRLPRAARTLRTRSPGTCSRLRPMARVARRCGPSITKRRSALIPVIMSLLPASIWPPASRR